MEELKKHTQYVHIPKCAGNSVLQAILSASETKSAKVLDSVAIYKSVRQLGDFSNDFSFEEKLLAAKQNLLSFYLEQGHGTISGHFVFSPLCQRAYGHRTNFFTTLREPIKRLKSHIAYLIFAHPRTCLEDYENGKVDLGEEVERIVNSSLGEWLGRTQVLYLGGLNENGKPDLHNRLKNAILSLEKFDLIGSTDDLPDMCRKFQNKYGRNFEMQRLNTIKSVQKNDNLLDQVYSALDSFENKLTKLSEEDSILYNTAMSKK